MNTIQIRRTSIVSLLLTVVLISGCATIVKGSSQGVTVKTDPPGASCDLARKGKTVGFVNPTPGTVQLGKSASAIDVVCKKTGHLDASTRLASSFQGWTLGNAVLGGIVGIVVDAGSGAMHEYPSEISVALLPESFASIENRDAYFNARRAEVLKQSESAREKIGGRCAKDQCEKLLTQAAGKTEEALAQVESGRKSAVIAPTAATQITQPPAPPRNETISPVVAPAAADSQVAAATDQFLKVGDRWKYKFSDRGKGAGSVTVEIMESNGRRVRERFTRDGYKGFAAERDFEIVFGPGRFLTPVALPGGYLLTEIAPYLPPGTELKAGQIWDNVPGIFFISDTGKMTLVSHVRVATQENVQVPAGAFSSWRIETESETSLSWSRARVKCTFWYAPEVKRTVKMTIDTIASLTANSGSETYELVSFDAGRQ